METSSVDLSPMKERQEKAQECGGLSSDKANVFLGIKHYLLNIK